MAFDRFFFSLLSNPPRTNCPNIWTYVTDSDNAAQVRASGYFNEEGLVDGRLAVNDIIYAVSTDGEEWLNVTAITPNVTTEVATNTIGDGAVTTAKLADGAVTSEKTSELLIQHAQVDVVLADFIGSNTASVEILAAPGADKKIVVHRATLHIDYGGTVLAAGGTVQLQYANDADAGGTFATGTVAAADLIAAEADTSFGFSPVDTTLTDATTLNEGLYLSTATQDFTGGTGSAYKVDVWYSVMDVA